MKNYVKKKQKKSRWVFLFPRKKQKKKIKKEGEKMYMYIKEVEEKCEKEYQKEREECENIYVLYRKQLDDKLRDREFWMREIVEKTEDMIRKNLKRKEYALYILSLEKENIEEEKDEERKLNIIEAFNYLFSKTKKVEKFQNLRKLIKKYKEKIEEYIEEKEKEITQLKEELKRKLEEIIDEENFIRVVQSNSISDDSIIPQVAPSYVTIEDNYVGDGGFSRRFGKREVQLLKGELNGRKAILYKAFIATYFRGVFRGLQKFSAVFGFDDGHFFVCRVPYSSQSVEDAIEKIIPTAIKKAIQKGVEVKRQGDLWFLPVQRQKPQQQEIERISYGRHIIYGFERGKKVYALKVEHPQHGVLEFQTPMLVLRNKEIGYGLRGAD